MEVIIRADPEEVVIRAAHGDDNKGRSWRK